MIRKIIYNIFAFFVICILFFGCHSPRTVVKAPIKEYGTDFLLEKMNETQFHFQTLSMKASISLTSNASKESTDLTGNVRIIRDSIIWISFSPGLGIELARLYITQDSVFFLNRLNSQYISSSFAFFNVHYKIDVDFNILQSLLIGNDFNYYESSKFKASYDGERYRLTMQERRKQKKYIRNNEDVRRVLVQDTWLNAKNFKIEAVSIRALEDQRRKLQVNYSNFLKTEEQLFPQKELFELFVQESGKNHKSNLSVDFSKIEFDKEVSTPFSILDKYTRINL